MREGERERERERETKRERERVSEIEREREEGVDAPTQQDRQRHIARKKGYKCYPEE